MKYPVKVLKKHGQEWYKITPSEARLKFFGDNNIK